MVDDNSEVAAILATEAASAERERAEYADCE